MQEGSCRHDEFHVSSIVHQVWSEMVSYLETNLVETSQTILEHHKLFCLVFCFLNDRQLPLSWILKNGIHISVFGIVQNGFFNEHVA